MAGVILLRMEKFFSGKLQMFYVEAKLPRPNVWAQSHMDTPQHFRHRLQIGPVPLTNIAGWPQRVPWHMYAEMVCTWRVATW